jgi:mannose-6-phosphate isomerase-like protein (cupin superfamily)
LTRRDPNIEVVAMTVMVGFVERIEDMALANDAFRRVVYTAPHSQLVLMCLEPGEDIGVETHADIDQFFRIERGQGEIVLEGVSQPISAGSAVVVPAGTRHNLVNGSTTERLHLSTIYSPPAHRDGVVHRTKAEASADESDHT